MDRLPTYQTPSDGRLSAEMLADYDEHGVLVLEGFVDPRECTRLKERVAELVEAFDPGEVGHIFSATEQTQLGDAYFEESGDKVRFFFEHDAFDDRGRLRQPKLDSLNKMGHAMHDLDSVFDSFSRTPALAQVAADIGIAEPGIIQSMVIFKPPRIGGEVQCHQDSTYIFTEPLSCIGFWFALEDASLENGCMQFIPGAHKFGLKKRQRRGEDDKLRLETIDSTPWPGTPVPAEAKIGTLVIFDGCTPHLSGPNFSSRSRCAYTLHAIDRRCQYPADNWLQRSAELPLRGFTS